MRSLTAPTSGWVRWFDAPAPPERLATFRILLFGFATAYLLARLPVFASLADDAAGRWDTVGVLWWLRTPPPAAVVTAALVAALAGGLLATAGVVYRVAGPLCAGAVLVLTTIRSSTGQLLWFENLFVLHLLVIALAPAADARRVRRRELVRGAGPLEPSVRYGHPLRLAAAVTVLTYALAGLAKLRGGGMAWLDGESLRRHVAYSATRLDVMGGTASPLAEPLLDAGWLLGPLAIATVVLELGAPLVLVARRLVVPWVVGVWLMHAAIALTMFVVFPYPLLLIAFAPLFQLERLGRGPAREGSAAME